VTKSFFFRIFIFIVALVLLGNQIASYVYIKQLDSKFSKIITKSTTILTSLETITHETSNIQRALLKIALAAPPNYPQWEAKINPGQQKIDSQFNYLDKLTAAKPENSVIRDLKNLYIEYKSQCNIIRPLLEAENFPGTHENDKLEKLHNAYDSYLELEEKDIVLFREKAEKESVMLSATSNKISAMLLFVGTLPYMLFACALIISFVILLWLGFLVKWFRHQD
jgi:hypothetical protein